MGNPVGSSGLNGDVNEAALGGKYVTITSAGNETSNTFTIKGTDAGDNVIYEVISGANAGTAIGTKSFKTVYPLLQKILHNQGELKLVLYLVLQFKKILSMVVKERM